MHDVKDDETSPSLILIRKCAQLGAKIAFVVLAPICVLVMLGMFGLLSYQSLAHGMTPIDLLHAMGNSSSGGETVLSKFLKGLAAGPLLVVIGVLSSAVTGGLIGAVAAAIGIIRCRARRRGGQD